MGAAELSHAGDQKRQHDPDRPGEGSAPASTRSTSIARPTWSRLSASCIRNCSYGGNRAHPARCGRTRLPEAALRHCVALALTYHSGQAEGRPGQ